MRWRKGNEIVAAIPQAGGRQVNKLVFLAVVSAALISAQVAVLVIPPLLVPIAEHLDISVAVAGQVNTVTFAAWAVSVILCGPLSDSLGRRPMALLGLFLLAASTIATAFAPNIQIMLAVRVFTGLGGGMVPPNSVAAVSEVISPEKRAQAIGGLMSVNIFGLSIVVPLLALLAEWLGWQAPVVAAGLALALALLLNWLWFPHDSGERVRDLTFISFISRYRSLLSIGFFRTAIFVMVNQRIAYWVMVSYLAAFLIKAYGVSVGGVAIPLACSAAGQVIGSYSAGLIATRKERALLVAGTTLVGGFCALVFFSIPISYWTAVALSGIGTGLLSITFPTLVAISTEYSGSSRATGIGLIGVGNQSGGAIGAAIAGALLASVGYGAVGYMCVGVAFASAAAAVLFMRQPPRRAE